MASLEELRERAIEKDVDGIMAHYINLGINEVLDAHEYIPPEFMRECADKHFQKLLLEIGKARNMNVEELQKEYSFEINEAVMNKYAQRGN